MEMKGTIKPRNILLGVIFLFLVLATEMAFVFVALGTKERVTTEDISIQTQLRLFLLPMKNDASREKVADTRCRWFNPSSSNYELACSIVMCPVTLSGDGGSLNPELDTETITITIT